MGAESPRRSSGLTTTAALKQGLRTCLQSHQLVLAESPEILSGTREAISMQWLLGRRSTVFTASCHFDEARHAVRFRDRLVAQSWGITPPMFTFETTRLVGTHVGVRRTERGVGGGGNVFYAEVRDAVKALVETHGWSFEYEVGRAPERP